MSVLFYCYRVWKPCQTLHSFFKFKSSSFSLLLKKGAIWFHSSVWIISDLFNQLRCAMMQAGRRQNVEVCVSPESGSVGQTQARHRTWSAGNKRMKGRESPVIAVSSLLLLSHQWMQFNYLTPDFLSAPRGREESRTHTIDRKEEGLRERDGADDAKRWREMIVLLFFNPIRVLIIIQARWVKGSSRLTSAESNLTTD